MRTSATVACGVLLSVLSTLLFACTTRSYLMPTNGMRPTLVAGNRVKVDLRAYQASDPQLGDLVLFIPVGRPDKRWVFRVAGLPGDRLAYKDDRLNRNNQVLVSGAAVEKQTFGPAVLAESPFEDDGLQLKENEYFLLSDDPEHLNDSRAWGPVPRQNILGKVIGYR